MSPNRKQSIVLEAISATSELGFRKTNARSVAARLGIQPSNVFYYFKTERDLTAAMLEEILRTNLEVVAKVHAKQKPKSSYDQILSYLTGNIEWAFSHSEQVAVLTFGVCEGRSDPGLLQLVNLALDNGEGKIYQMIVAGIAEKEFELAIDLKPREAARALHQCLIGHILRSATSDEVKSEALARVKAILKVFIE